MLPLMVVAGDSSLLLQQIRCVFPRAFNFSWEPVGDRMNRKTCNFELHIEINLDYDKTKEPMKKLDERKKAWQKITPAAQVERLKVRQLINFLVSFRYW